MKPICLSISFAMAVLIAACAGWDDLRRKDSFEETAKLYAHSMRWSDFETAMVFVRQPDAPTSADLQNIKVTAYDVKQHLIVQEGARIRQVAAVSYFKKSDMLVRTLACQEIWELDEAENQWFIVSGFPEFK